MWLSYGTPWSCLPALCRAAWIPPPRSIPGIQDKAQHISKYLHIVSSSLCTQGYLYTGAHSVPLDRAASHSAVCQQGRQQTQAPAPRHSHEEAGHKQGNIHSLHWKTCAIHFQEIKLTTLTVLPSHTPPTRTTERRFLLSEQVHCYAFSSLHKLYSSQHIFGTPNVHLVQQPSFREKVQQEVFDSIHKLSFWMHP